MKKKLNLRKLWEEHKVKILAVSGSIIGIVAVTQIAKSKDKEETVTITFNTKDLLTAAVGEDVKLPDWVEQKSNEN